MIRTLPAHYPHIRCTFPPLFPSPPYHPHITRTFDLVDISTKNHYPHSTCALPSHYPHVTRTLPEHYPHITRTFPPSTHIQARLVQIAIQACLDSEQVTIWSLITSRYRGLTVGDGRDIEREQTWRGA